MPIRDSELEPESVFLRHLHKLSFANKKKVTPILGFQLRYRPAPTLYDATLTLAAGENNAHAICYGGGFIWVVLWLSPTQLLKINPETMAYTKRIFDVGDNQGYAICWDGRYVWISSSTTPIDVYRVEPSDMSYTKMTLTPAEGPGNAICFDGTYIWVTGTFAAGALYRIHRDTLTFDRLALGVGNDAPRSLVWDGQFLWAGGDEGKVWKVNTTALTFATYQAAVGWRNKVYALTFDGSYVWGFTWGTTPWGPFAYKINPDTGAMYEYFIMPTSFNWFHGACFDGKYVYAHCYTTNQLIVVHPETMEFNVLLDRTLGHGMCFDGKYLWTVYSSTPGVIKRWLFQEPQHRFEAGVTETIDISALGTKTQAVTFDMPFRTTPNVIVCLQDISDTTAEILNVEAQNITTTGFNCRAKVITAGGGGSTARFSWFAISKDIYKP